MKIICIGRNYMAHIKELNHSVPEKPIFFFKPDSALLQKNSPFYYPDFSNEIHYETEIVVRIDKIGKSISPEYSNLHYSEIALGLDLTARDIQRYEIENSLPWTLSKAFDYSAPISKFFPISDFSNNIQDINFKLYKNNELVQNSNTSDMIFTIDYLISYISQFISLKVGDLIFTGTPPGVGEIKIGDKLQGYIENNKVLECEIK
jgi:2-keto-4-pentenoate hydratase/2-oxohepta-3-ene-1,7-dioic acid hydratase in catechol pathway